MKKLTCIPFAKLTALVFMSTILVLSGCVASKGSGFAIYLTRNDISPDRMPDLGQVDLAELPLISISDIISYNAQTYELKLTADAFERICNLDVPVRGRSFVVCVDRKPVYWGAFWTPISSISFDGVTIWKPLLSQEPHIIRLDLGYPSPAFYGGEDPRNNFEVIKSLKQCGKWIERLSLTSVDSLPHSMKGYELYSWSEGRNWHFTLITGTDRNKTVEEIVSNDNVISEAGWERIHVVGIDAIKTVLKKLQKGEEIFWLGRLRSEQAPSGNTNFSLPAESVVNSVKEYAESCGLNLRILE